MQKTVLHRNIDGHEVITGFADAHPDPVATWRNIAGLAAELPEQLAIAAKLQQIKDRQRSVFEPFQQVWGRPWDGVLRSQEEANWLSQATRAAQADIDVFANELPALAAALETARTALFHSNAIYFHPGTGEDLISAEDHARLLPLCEGAGPNQCVTIEGTVVEDLRGQVFWISKPRWVRSTITALGESVPAGAILEQDLTADQRAEIANQEEGERIGLLTPDQRAAELAQRLDSAAAQAINRSQIATVKGEQFDQVAWYAEQKAALSAKYA